MGFFLYPPGQGHLAEAKRWFSVRGKTTMKCPCPFSVLKWKGTIHCSTKSFVQDVKSCKEYPTIEEEKILFVSPCEGPTIKSLCVRTPWWTLVDPGHLGNPGLLRNPGPVVTLVILIMMILPWSGKPLFSTAGALVVVTV